MAEEATALETAPAPEQAPAPAPEPPPSTVPLSSGDQGLISNLLDKVNLDMRSLVLLMVATAVVIFFLFQFVFKEKYRLLYSGLSQSDAAAMSSYLQKKGVKYLVSEDGSQISITGASVPKTRLSMASMGLPRGGGVGFEIFDKTSLNISDFNQKVNYNRALEGELSRTIESLETIDKAKVHLALGKKSVFAANVEEPKASVIVETAYSAKLTDDQVKGIQHLVGSAVNGLKAENVQITDQHGNPMVKLKDKDSINLEISQKNEDRKRTFEKKMEKDLVDLLTPILGKGNVLVNVTSEMNFDESEMNIELFNPILETGEKTSPVVRSEKVIQEKYKRAKETSFGTGGAQRNLPSIVGDSVVSAGIGPNRNYVKEDSTKNYELSKSIERVKKEVGQLQKMSVAVVVNKELNPAERSTLRETVRVAAGLDMTRGDQVIITGIRFSSSQYSDLQSQKEQKRFKEQKREEKIKKYTSMILIIAIGIAFISIVIFSLSSSLDASNSKVVDELLKEDDIPILETIDEKIQEAEEAYQRNLTLDSDKTVQHMKDTLSQMAVKDPRAIAQSLQSYLMD